MNRREVLKAVLDLGAVVVNRGIIGDLLGKSKESKQAEADNVDPLLPVENEDPFWEQKVYEYESVTWTDTDSNYEIGTSITLYNTNCNAYNTDCNASHTLDDIYAIS